MFYKYANAEHPTVTRCRTLINNAMLWDDTHTLTLARSLLDSAIRAQQDMKLINDELDQEFERFATRVQFLNKKENAR